MNKGKKIKRSGMSKSVEYKTWSSIKERCYNPNGPKFDRYGGRGIIVCDEWRNDFMAFYRDMGDRPSASHSIDRIDNDGPYAPWNCRWATIKQQANNRANIIQLVIDGVSYSSIAEAARSLNISVHVLYRRTAKQAVQEQRHD